MQDLGQVRKPVTLTYFQGHSANFRSETCGRDNFPQTSIGISKFIPKVYPSKA